MLTLILVSLAVMAISALASGVEAAVFTVPYTRVKAMASKGEPGWKTLLKVKDDMTQAIGTVVIVNNIGNIVGSGLVGLIAHDVFSDVAIGIFFAAFTLAVIVFAELVPKTVGEAHAERIAIAVAPGLLFVTTAFRPVLWLVSILVKPFHLGDAMKIKVSEDEIRLMALMGHQSGAIETDESTLIRHVFKLNDITAEDMMTAASAVESIPADLKLGEGRERILNARHSRLPVIAEDGETVLGVVLTRDLIAALAQDKFDATPLDYLQEAVRVPLDLPADDLLPMFQKIEQHLGIVHDAAGKIVGVVSLEDIIEELVGEITDEKDVRPETIKRISKTEILVDEGTDIAKVNHFFNTVIVHEGTIGDYVGEKFGKRPRVGESFSDGALTVTVINMTRTRPQLLKIAKTA